MDTSSNLPRALQRKVEKTLPPLVTAPTAPPLNAPAPATAAQTGAPAAAPAPVAELDLSQFAVPDEPAAPAAAPAAPAAAPAPAAVAPAATAPLNDIFGTPITPPAAAPAAHDYGADIANINAQLTAMREGQVAAATSQAPARLSVDAPEVSAEVAAQYNVADPYIRRVIAEMINETVAPVVNNVVDSMPTLAASVDQLSQGVAASSQQQFRTTLRAAIPDIDALAVDPNFLEYTKQALPGTGGTMSLASVLASKYKAGDIGAVRGIVDEYRASAAGQPQQQVPPQNAMVAPAPAPAPTHMPAAGVQSAKPMLAMSKRKLASDQFSKGLLPAEQFAQIRQAYDEAFAEGRVDENK